MSSDLQGILRGGAVPFSSPPSDAGEALSLSRGPEVLDFVCECDLPSGEQGLHTEAHRDQDALWPRTDCTVLGTSPC